MSRWRFERAPRHVWGVDAQGVAWAARDRGLQVDTADHGEDCAQALAHSRGAARIDAIASNDFAVHWLQQPPSAVRTLEELKLVAATRCARLFGGTPADWWIAGDWSIRRAFVCSALPRAVAEPLERACQAQGARLHWHSAWSVMCSARADRFPDEGWSAMRSARRVMLWHCSGGRVDAITSVATAPDVSGEQLAVAIEVQMKLESAGGAAAPGALHWADPAGRSAREAVDALALAPLLEGAA